MFSPLDNIVEDPATGSATAAAAALIAQLEGRDDLSLQMLQGVDMGRPSELYARVAGGSTTAASAYVGGHCVAVMEGTIVTD
jgi:trans-2,3-dihydro-3-hydroxyanthranilate isomerase